MNIVGVGRFAGRREDGLLDNGQERVMMRGVMEVVSGARVVRQY